MSEDATPNVIANSTKARANYIGVPDFYNLNLACSALVEAFGPSVYLVGSCQDKRDFRDVDIRAILDDEHYDRLFADSAKHQQLNATWNLVCVAISEWLAKRTGLPIDFQIQRMTESNAEFHGRRSCLGIFVRTSKSIVST